MKISYFIQAPRNGDRRITHQTTSGVLVCIGTSEVPFTDVAVSLRPRGRNAVELWIGLLLAKGFVVVAAAFCFWAAALIATSAAEKLPQEEEDAYDAK